MTLEQKLEWLRSRGWTVAVHNDYRLNGESHTFWLWVKSGITIKGEARTDHRALDIVIDRVSNKAHIG